MPPTSSPRSNSNSKGKKKRLRATVRACEPRRGSRSPGRTGGSRVRVCGGCIGGGGAGDRACASFDGEPDAMLLGCGSLSSWVRRLVACVGYDSLPIHLAPSLARLVLVRWALCCRAIAPSVVTIGDLYRAGSGSVLPFGLDDFVILR